MTDETTVAPDVPAVTADAPPVETPQPQERDKRQERIDELTRKNARLEGERDSVRRELEEFRKAKAPAEKQELKRPTLEESGYDEDKHKAALDAYYESLIESKAEEKVAKLLEKQEAERAAKAREESFATRFGKLSAEERDVANTAHVTEFAANLIKESEYGPQIALELGQNPERAQQIAKLPEYLQAKEIGRIEARYEAKASAKTETPAEKQPEVSKAPPPVPKIEATDSKVEKDPKDMSDAEFARWRKRQIAQRR